MKFLSLFSLFLLLTGCDSYVDDQSLMSKEQEQEVNPTPTPRDFELNNSRHKVIVAILDSGIDYNHPALQNNIHFTLDDGGKPVAAGWDYLGNDPWPAPYVARTDDINPEIAIADQMKAKQERETFKILVTLFPSLKEVFSPDRSIFEEIEETISHGTHVAGLASFDSDAIGLRGYRVLPFNRLSQNKDQANLLFRTFTTTLLQGIGDAIQDGARVLNMSLGVLSNQVDAKEFKKFQEDLISIADENPEVFFVVAAGNEGEVLDVEKMMSLPCYIPRKNVICVSALDKNLNPTDFSNTIPHNEVVSIFAWGEDIISTIPTNFCPEEFSLPQGEEALKSLGEKLEKKCAESPLFQKMSGTSMASPIIAREIAKIIAEEPLKSAESIREALFEKAITHEYQGRMIFKFPITKPSWYQIKGLKLSKPSLYLRKSLMTN